MSCCKSDIGKMKIQKIENIVMICAIVIYRRPWSLVSLLNITSRYAEITLYNLKPSESLLCNAT